MVAADHLIIVSEHFPSGKSCFTVPGDLMGIHDVVFPSSNSFGVFSHSKGFGAEFASGLYGSLGQIRLTEVGQVSWRLWSSGAGPLRAAERFVEGSSKVSPRLSNLGLLTGSAEGSTKAPPRFHQGSSKGAPRFHQGS